MLQIITGQPVVKWASEQLGIPDFGRAEGLGIWHIDRLVAGIIYSNFSGGNIEMSIASIDPHWCSRQALRVAFLYPFAQLGCRRVTATVAVHNEKARRMLGRLGFTLEGFHPQVMQDGSDGLSYGMLRADCRWISRRSSASETHATA